MSDNTFRIGQQIICILHSPDPDIIGVAGGIIQNLLRLFCSGSHNLICLGIRLLHDLMLAHQFICVDLRLFDHAVCFSLCIRKDRILICNDLLVTFYLIRSLHPELP